MLFGHNNQKRYVTIYTNMVCGIPELKLVQICNAIEFEGKHHHDSQATDTIIRFCINQQCNGEKIISQERA
jgi:hypothetical protein